MNVAPEVVISQTEMWLQPSFERLRLQPPPLTECHSSWPCHQASSEGQT